MEGIKVARSSVAVFLDSHCECSPDWLRPLLQRLKDKPDAVVTPDIDTIEKTDLMMVDTRIEEVDARVEVTAHVDAELEPDGANCPCNTKE